MTEAEKARRLRASSTFRQKQAKHGQAQVNVWLDEGLREKLDQVIKSGRFKNRSEATSQALSKLLESQEM